MSRIIGFFLIFFIILVAIFFLISPTTDEVLQTNDLAIAASIFPLAHIAEQILPDRIKVLLIARAGSDSHTFEPSPSDILNIQKSRLFIYNGAGFDTWAEKVSETISSEDTKSIEVAEQIDLIEIQDEDQFSEFDPHFWLDPLRAKIIAEIIKNEVISAGLASEQEIEPSYSNYMAQLDQLHADYETGLAECASREIVVAHDAFGYLANRYGIEVISIAGLSPQDEPSARSFADIIQKAKMNQIDYIFFEELSSPRLSEALAEELGAKTLVLNPIEALGPGQGNETYISLMRDNLRNLQVAMSCKVNEGGRI